MAWRESFRPQQHSEAANQQVFLRGSSHGMRGLGERFEGEENDNAMSRRGYGHGQGLSSMRRGSSSTESPSIGSPRYHTGWNDMQQFRSGFRLISPHHMYIALMGLFLIQNIAIIILIYKLFRAGL